MNVNSIRRVLNINNSYNNKNITTCLGRVFYTSNNNNNNNGISFTPKEIKLSEKGKRLEITFNKIDHDNIKTYSFSSEFLRIETPSVEKTTKKLGISSTASSSSSSLSIIAGRRDVSIIRIERVGNYAVRLVFDDLHDTGIYSWEYLYKLGQTKYSKMKQYLKLLKEFGKSRDPKIHNKQFNKNNKPINNI